MALSMSSVKQSLTVKLTRRFCSSLVTAIFVKTASLANRGDGKKQRRIKSDMTLCDPVFIIPSRRRPLLFNVSSPSPTPEHVYSPWPEYPSPLRQDCGELH
jgi:hypothetical protein